jgi:hypothetical protein
VLFFASTLTLIGYSGAKAGLPHDQLQLLW